MSRLQNLGCVLWGIACGVSAAGAQALPTPSAPAVARVNASSASVPATGSLLITIKELDATTAADATLLTEPTDVVGASTTPPTVTFDRPLALPTTGSQRNWVLPFRVAGMPAGAELTRYFSFKLGTADWTLGYQLSSPAAVVTSWGLKPTPVQVRAIAPDEPLPLSVTIVGPCPSPASASRRWCWSSRAANAHWQPAS